MLCNKGAALGETVSHEGRLMSPHVDGVETSWDSAISHVANGFSETIKKYGPDSVAFYVSGQLLTEDYYVANKLMKGFIGSGNIDSNSRLCMASSVVGHKRAFGADIVPVCYEDLEHTELVVITGSNLAWCHPILFNRIKKAKQQNAQLKVIVVDPRKTETCEIADVHLAINSGTDVALFNGLLSYLSRHGGLDAKFLHESTNGSQETLMHAHLESDDLDKLAVLLGVDKQALIGVYDLFTKTEKVVTIYSQGVNQSSQGCDKVNSILNCHLASGKIGKVGSGPFSVTGQPNAMGGREVGALANTLAAHMEFDSKGDREQISRFWDTLSLASKPGLKAVDMFDAMAMGKIKAVWIMATNPAVSLPNQSKIHAALERCPLVVVSDCIKDTATTHYANVLLPAQGWSEKSGTVTNSERRISRQRRLLPSPGLAKPDWWIVSQVAGAMGFGDAFDYRHEGEIFREYARMTTLKGDSERALDLNGLTTLSDREYNFLTPQQWPVLKVQTVIKSQRLFENGRFYTQSSKANLIPVRYMAIDEAKNDSRVRLNTGRTKEHWHTMTRSGLSLSLSELSPEPLASIHPETAKRIGVINDDFVTVSNLEKELKLRVALSDSMKVDDIFIPIHWNYENSGQSTVCDVIDDKVDPISGQPEFKYTLVEASRWPKQSEAKLFSTEKFVDFSAQYWVRQKVTDGYVYHIASTGTTQELALSLMPIINKQKGVILSYQDSAYGVKVAKFDSGVLSIALVVGDTLKHEELNWFQGLDRSKSDTGHQHFFDSCVA
jgi:assimilatory nitrate reductase catalytic subunit